jgi:hypothetical protein
MRKAINKIHTLQIPSKQILGTPESKIAMQSSDKTVFEYEMFEALKAELAEAYTQKNWFKENFTNMRHVMSKGEQENKYSTHG